MNATEAVAAALEAAPDALGWHRWAPPSSAVRSASDDGPHFYMGGAMGCGLGIALGIADGAPDRTCSP